MYGKLEVYVRSPGCPGVFGKDVILLGLASKGVLRMWFARS